VAFGKLAEEVALLTVDPGADDAGMPDDVEDMLAEEDSPGIPLRVFASDPSAPAALAARALAWHEHIRYGLWRMGEPVPAPGLWCADIVSGTERYVESPAETTAGLPRWTVSQGNPRSRPPSIPFGHAEPHGVYADDQEPVPAATASLIGKVTGALITRIVADVHRYQARPLAVANTDGDPMCLITAMIVVHEGMAAKLAERPDFDLDTGEPDRITWWGALIPTASAIRWWLGPWRSCAPRAARTSRSPTVRSAGCGVCCGSAAARSPSR
jgi:hypothetical protein